jgi:putative FmdB family regulatory protein
MPIYEYACTACGERTEAKQSFDEPPLQDCPVCGGKLRKLYSPVGIVFKGSGFYSTDKKGPKRAAEKKDSEGTKSQDKQKSPSGEKSSSASEKSSSDKSSGSKATADKSRSGASSRRSGSRG